MFATTVRELALADEILHIDVHLCEASATLPIDHFLTVGVRAANFLILIITGRLAGAIA